MAYKPGMIDQNEPQYKLWDKNLIFQLSGGPNTGGCNIDASKINHFLHKHIWTLSENLKFYIGLTVNGIKWQREQDFN